MTDELTHRPAGPAAPRRGRTGAAGALLRRWPTALALASGALILGSLAAAGPGTAEAVTPFAELLVLLPLVYLVVAATGRRGWTWPVLASTFGLLVAAGWLAHGVWDFAHLRADAVISRSYAEACGVLDILVATGLIALPLLL